MSVVLLLLQSGGGGSTPHREHPTFASFPAMTSTAVFPDKQTRVVVTSA